ncbi:MAG TPA: PLP-dependent transferase [Longimicrobium sp.]|nr:PLP-dependent transferase [Longimicrobium sp.]
MDKHLSGITRESWLVSAGRPSEPGAPLNVPLVPAANFIIGSGRDYSRDDGTPTWEALEAIVGGLEAGRAVAFASGMAAIASVFDQLPVGAVVALPDDCYQGVAGLAAAGAERGRWSVRRVAVEDTAGWIDACGVADLVWLESRPTRCSRSWIWRLSARRHASPERSWRWTTPSPRR